MNYGLILPNINSMEEQYYFFYKTNHPFSQWYKVNFVVNGITFCCVEQYMMYYKSLLFNDEETAAQILKSKNQRLHKELGRNVKNFNDYIWRCTSSKIVYEGNKNKFLQNKEILQKLLDTKGKIIVEASPYDRIWGIGLSENDPDRFNRSRWKGENKLGYILSKLRDDILNDTVSLNSF